MTRVGLEPTTFRFALQSATTAQPGLRKTQVISFTQMAHILQNRGNGSALEYESRGRGFESYSGHLHSNKLSRLIHQILLILKFTNIHVLLGIFQDTSVIIE